MYHVLEQSRTNFAPRIKLKQHNYEKAWIVAGDDVA